MPEASGDQTLFIWLAALAALALFAMAGRVADLFSAKGHGGAGRVYRGLAHLLVPLLLLLPPLVVETPGVAVNIGLLFYILFFSGFCYYVGKRLGWKAGRRHMSELIGMETPDSLEDTQDRLFESRLRHPHRAEVVKSIGELAKAADAAKEQSAKDREQPDFKLKL